MKFDLKLISLLLILSLITVSTVYADDGNETTQITDNVTSSDVKPFIELKNITDNAEPGDTIKLDCDYEYSDNYTLIGVLIQKPLTIDGQGHTLDGKNTGRILSIEADNFVLKNITFINGYCNESIGGVRCQGNNIQIIDCTFINNNANGSSAGTSDAVGIVGGGAYVKGNNTYIARNTFINNTVGGSGGGIAVDGQNCLIENNLFINNKALRHMNGGALQVGRGSSTIIRNNTFLNNYAGMGGGAIELQHSSDDLIANNTFINNGADYGGALSIYNTSYFTLRDNDFADNYGNGDLGLGGALRVYLIEFTNTSLIANNTITNSLASVTGGAFYIFGDNINITENSFINNTAASKGGGIINALGNDITISNNEIINNTAATHGGSIYIDGNNNQIVSNNIVNSTAGTGGGAIYAKGDFTAIEDNNITNSKSGGHSGGLYGEGNNILISDNAFENNAAASFGGAVSVNGENTVISDNTFENNQASSTSNGGAIRTTGNNAKITGNTFNNNTAGKGSDILVWEGDNSEVSSNNFVDYKDTSLVCYGDEVNVQDNGGIVDTTSIVVLSGNYYITNANKMLTVRLVNSKGNAITGKYIKFSVNGVTYSATTNEAGEASVKVGLSALGSYKSTIKFNGDSYNKASTQKVTIKVVKEPSKITAKNKKFKRYAKSKKVAIKLKTSAGKAITNKQVILKVNGKKYTATTNSKGKATFSIKLTKKGTFIYAVKFKGDGQYKAVKQKARIKLK